MNLCARKFWQPQIFVLWWSQVWFWNDFFLNEYYLQPISSGKFFLKKIENCFIRTFYHCALSCFLWHLVPVWIFLTEHRKKETVEHASLDQLPKGIHPWKNVFKPIKRWYFTLQKCKKVKCQRFCWKLCLPFILQFLFQTFIQCWKGQIFHNFRLNYSKSKGENFHFSSFHLL